MAPQRTAQEAARSRPRSRSGRGRARTTGRRGRRDGGGPLERSAGPRAQGRGRAGTAQRGLGRRRNEGCNHGGGAQECTGPATSSKTQDFFRTFFSHQVKRASLFVPHIVPHIVPNERLTAPWTSSAVDPNCAAPKARVLVCVHHELEFFRDLVRRFLSAVALFAARICQPSRADQPMRPLTSRTRFGRCERVGRCEHS